MKEGRKVLTTQRGGRFLVVLACGVLCAFSAAAQTGTPTIAASGVRNAADYSATVAPGMLVAVFGSNLAPRTAAATSVPLPESLEGVSLEVIDGSRTFRAPLFFVSAGQINAQLPYEISGNQIQLRVRTATGVSNTVSVAVLPCLPRLLTKTMDGKGEALLLHANYSLVSEAAPALPGEVVILYLAGLGAVTPTIAAGRRAGDGRQAPLNVTEGEPVVWVGGRQAEVLWSGLAPGWAGLYQVNIKMPEFLASGQHGIVVEMNGAASQDGVWIAGGPKVWKEAVSSNVGPGGGVVSAGELRITVPPGAFAEQQTLKISASAESVSPTGALATGVWQISGIPRELSAPLAISLPLASSQTPDGEAVVFLKAGTEPDAGAIALPAKVQGGRLEATLPALGAESSAKNSGVREAFIIPKYITATMWGMAGFSTEKSPSGKFVVWFPRGDINDYDAAIETGKILDEAREKLRAIGIDVDGRRKTPIDVYLFRFSDLPGRLMVLSDDHNGMTESEVWGRDDMGLQLNLNTFHRNREEFRVTVGHELFHLYQSYYDPRRWLQRTFAGASWLWMWEAASTWFERKMSSAGRNYLADTTLANAKFLFKGGLEKLPGGASALTGTADVRNHGYGAASFLQFFTRGNDAVVGEIIKRSAESSGLILTDFRYTPVSALWFQDVFLSSRWLEFCQQYVEGKVHPLINFTMLRQSGKQKKTDLPSYSFTDGGEQKFSYVWDSQDLSAAQYEIRLDRAKLNWPAGTTLVLRLNDPHKQAVAFVYRPSGSTYSLMQKFDQEYRISNAETLVSPGGHLYILLVNPRAERPYTGITQIKLEGEVLPAIPQYRQFSVYVSNVPVVETYKETGRPVQSRNITSSFMMTNIEANQGGQVSFPNGIVPIVWNGSSFSGQGEGTFKGPAGNGKGTIKIAFGGQIGQDKSLINFWVRREIHCTYPTYTYDSVEEFRFKTIPVSGVPGQYKVADAGTVVSSWSVDKKMVYQPGMTSDEWRTYTADRSRALGDLQIYFQ